MCGVDPLTGRSLAAMANRFFTHARRREIGKSGKGICDLCLKPSHGIGIGDVENERSGWSLAYLIAAGAGMGFRPKSEHAGLQRQRLAVFQLQPIEIDFILLT